MTSYDLAAFSNDVADIAEKAAPAVASLQRGHLTVSAFHWRDGLYVSAEEAIGDAEEIELTLGFGAIVQGQLVGRDASTGIALIRAAGQDDAPVLDKAEPPRTGSVVIALGNSEGMPLASFGVAALVGPAWRSMRGGDIARRINLGIFVEGRFEGGPVLDVNGALLGMLLFGTQRRVLVMPHETIEAAVNSLESKGHVSRGYLGASLHAVQHATLNGAMVMALDEDGPAQAAGMQLGDIIVSWAGEPVKGPRELVRRLGPSSADKPVVLGIVRGGEQRDITVAIGEKPLV